MTEEQAQERARKGGHARADAMTADERSESARRAAEARADALSAERRSEIARDASRERWSREEHFSDAAARARLARLR